ncbi:hypothetical protein [Caldicellulosiruptor naganoensis]|uniref:Uncharacterized protein n=1 Tax=Caldicellulosiruptor naganoensis TaxID=29324 RepID=A0ABY7BG42_9FIRM|nr:hypothetical protein [Caldicellulosiruptor naganoensis]WAM31378.1 hypothetical protein OTJ99_002240 [Caldicellulosiruptor naganoensis]
MYVGLNTNYHGQWNKNDSQLFEKLIKEKGPTQAQKIFLELSLKRLNAIIKEKKVISFSLDKIITMWHADHEAYDYAAEAQSKNLTAKIKLRKDNKIPKLIMNAYYLAILLPSLIALFLNSKNNDFTNPLPLIGCFIILGTILLHIPFEVALRYKNHSLIWFCFIAAQGIINGGSLITKILSKN